MLSFMIKTLIGFGAAYFIYQKKFNDPYLEKYHENKEEYEKSSL